MKENFKRNIQRPIQKGPVSASNLKNGEELIQYHNGKLKIIRKEFGKLFELEFKRSDHRELETFAKYSDIKKPQREAIKIIDEGVRIANDGTKKTYTTLPDTSDSEAVGGEAVVSSGNVIPK